MIVEELEKLAKETEFAAGYQRVRTPHIARESLYQKSGHLPYYAESMFPPMDSGGRTSKSTLSSTSAEFENRRNAKRRGRYTNASELHRELFNRRTTTSRR